MTNDAPDTGRQKGLTARLRKLFGSRSPDAAARICTASTHDADTAFRQATAQFKRLVSANNKALEVMAQIEQTLADGSRPYDLSYVRTHSTRVAMAVFQMVEAINCMADDKYSLLYARHDAISSEITSLLDTVPERPSGRLCYSLNELDATYISEVGGKAANLGELRNRMPQESGVVVPEGFAVSSHAFWLFMKSADLDELADMQLRQCDTDRLEDVYKACSRIRQAIVSAPVPDELASAMAASVAHCMKQCESAQTMRQYGTTGDPLQDVRFAVRSSALGEDEAEHSFAGQFASRLNIPADSLLDAWREVVASKYSPEAVMYRLQHGIPDRDVAVCALIMPMVDAVAGGVAYSLDPLGNNDISDSFARSDKKEKERITLVGGHLADNIRTTPSGGGEQSAQSAQSAHLTGVEYIAIHAVSGLPRGVVDGSMPVDRYSLLRPPEGMLGRNPHSIKQLGAARINAEDLLLTEKHIAHKLERFVLTAGEGVRKERIPLAQAYEPALEGQMIRRLGAVVLEIERHYGVPQDVEWALCRSGGLVILQTRPLSTRRLERLDVDLSGMSLLAKGGECASSGVGWGPVVLVRREFDALQFPDGAVLLVEHALPRWAPLLSRAAAVVAGTGSKVGHLANVAREFGVPALFGLGELLGAVQEGEAVTVDADAGRIYSGEPECPSCSPRPVRPLSCTQSCSTQNSTDEHGNAHSAACLSGESERASQPDAEQKKSPASVQSESQWTENEEAKANTVSVAGATTDNAAPSASCVRCADDEGGAERKRKMQQSRRPRLMDGSPVQQLLAQVAERVVPLHLTDPESTEFAPENCRTFHDITRFCHERAVDEIFRDGRDKAFPRHRARQLYHGRPMQFWVADLDDGFENPPQGKLIPLENITSVPMLALWQGMTAVPWEGPPRIRAGGLLSVIAQSAANPDIDPAAASAYTMRNYFLVSRKFCCLQSRFGYHFCTVEALIGDVPAENFASFRFKGGAADFERKMARIRFIRELLDEYGFRVNVTADNLSARCDNLPQADMERKLKILGYLTMHTRQLDMVLADSAVYAAKLAVFRNQIEQLD